MHLLIPRSIGCQLSSPQKLNLLGCVLVLNIKNSEFGPVCSLISSEISSLNYVSAALAARFKCPSYKEYSNLVSKSLMILDVIRLSDIKAVKDKPYFS